MDYNNGELMRCDWDVSFKGKDYFVYMWHRRFDSIEKAPKEYQDALYDQYKWYICPRNTPEDKIPEHLTQINKDDVGARWDIKIEENMRTYKKWDENRFTHNFKFKIYRNDRLFTEGFAGSLENAYLNAQSLINKYQDHPLGLGAIDFDKKMIGRKIIYRDEYAIIESFMWGEGSIWIIPDKESGCEKFKEPKHYSDDKTFPSYWEEYENGLQVPLTSEDIWWWRYDEKEETSAEA